MAEELWNTWFTVYEITKSDDFVLANQKLHGTGNQPIAARVTKDNKLQGSTKLASESEFANVKKQPLKEIAAIIRALQKAKFNQSQTNARTQA